MLARPGAWLEPVSNHYALRLGPDRRSRVALTLDEATWRALAEAPGLQPRKAGGWVARRAGNRSDEPPPPGRPGVIEGQQTVVDEAGHLRSHPANLAPTAIAWLAARRDVNGKPWLTPQQVAAGLRLSFDAERTLTGPSLTAALDAPPRSGSVRPRPSEPSDQVLDAARRVERALAAVGPRHRAVLEAVCVRGTALALAEGQLGLKRRQGKHSLIAALEALADHYGAPWDRSERRVGS